jgi:hypothetical protein
VGRRRSSSVRGVVHMIQTRGSLKSLMRTHREALHTSSRLTSYFRETHQPMAVDVKPERVIEVLHNAGIKPVLMGTHALNTYRDEPRATQDVDVLVRKRDVRKAIRVLHEAFPKLVINDTPVVTRFVDPKTEKVVLDVMKPSQTVFQVIFRHTVDVAQTHSIPDLEMALASKFAAMVSPHRRRDKKMLDGADFINVVLNNRKNIDVAKLARLAEKVYRGGSKEIVEMIRTIDAGGMLEL